MRLILKEIELENFMCYGNFEKTFPEGTTIISGRNGAGKSTIATAYTWLLFGCDYELKDNPVVRREINGKPIDDMDVRVRGTFEQDGREMIYEKVQRRTYSKDGKSYKDDNSYYVNSVPKTMKAFNECVGIDLDTFKMCTNVNTFLGKTPGKMREFLFSTARGISDLEIAESDGELQELAGYLKLHSAEELKAMNTATKAKIEKDLPVLEGQIKEKERDITIKSGMDVSDLELKKKSLEEKINACNETLNATQKIMKEYEKMSDKVLEIGFAINSLRREANAENEQKKNDLRFHIDEKKFELRGLEKKIELNNLQLKCLEESRDKQLEERNALANQWREENDREIGREDLCCPYCGAEYTKEKKEGLISDFNKKKSEQIEKIEKIGGELKEKIENLGTEIYSLQMQTEQCKAVCGTLETSISDLCADLRDLPDTAEVTGEEYERLKAELEDAEAAMNEEQSSKILKSSLEDEKRKYEAELLDCTMQINSSNTEKDEIRLSELREQRENLEQKKMDCKKVLSLLDDLDKAKNEALSNEINRNFGIVKWKLFEYAKNGGYKSVCIPTVDGKSILSVMSNKGNRIMGKLDICKGIQKISGFEVPVWLDDAEALDSTNFVKARDIAKPSQFIALVVEHDNKL